LVLSPINHLNLFQYKENIISALFETGIIHNKLIKEQENYYLAGKNYLYHISFIGCSPYLNFEPEKDIAVSDLKQTIADLNYIQFDLNPKKMSFRKIDFGIKSICPACKSRILEWKKLIGDWEKNQALIAMCPQCFQKISLLEINWKKTAGFYNSAILFHGIQAELAFPTDDLLMLLEQTTATKWQYFFG
jgi:hypothetical protein